MSVEGTTSLRMVNSLVFDELMAAVLKMVDKLDLSSQFVDQGEEVKERGREGGREGSRGEEVREKGKGRREGERGSKNIQEAVEIKEEP